MTSSSTGTSGHHRQRLSRQLNEARGRALAASWATQARVRQEKAPKVAAEWCFRFTPGGPPVRGGFRRFTWTILLFGAFLDPVGGAAYL